MFTLKDIFQLPVNEWIYNKTATNVTKKYNFTIKSLMYKRTPVELLDNLFMWDMAKNALFDYLYNECHWKEVIDYDEIRNDNFEEHDPWWDIQIWKTKVKVEVKSSIPPKWETYEDIINKRDIKITASHNRWKTFIYPEDLESYIHVQIYFYARPYKEWYNNFNELSNIITANPSKVLDIIHAEKYNSPLFFWYNTKDYIDKLYKFNRDNNKKTTRTFSRTDRVYWNCPIKDAHNMDELISFIKSI